MNAEHGQSLCQYKINFNQDVSPARSAPQIMFNPVAVSSGSLVRGCHPAAVSFGYSNRWGSLKAPTRKTRLYHRGFTSDGN